MILKPAVGLAPTKPVILDNVQQLKEHFSSVGSTYIDFEATGLDMRAEDFKVVGVGIASTQCRDGVYAPITSIDDYKWLVTELYQLNLVGYNIGYDAKVLHRMALDVGVTPTVWPWIGDTLILYKLLDNRGYTGQSWGLKTAQKEVLQWKETNEVELDKWLIDNGYSRKSSGVDKPLKGEMWRAPVEILGHYCGLDSVSTMQIDEYLHDAGKQFPEMMAIYEREFMTLSKLVHEQFWHGLHVDRSKLEVYLDSVNSDINKNLTEFLESSEATPYIEEFNAAQVKTILDAKPEQFTKTGKVAARYTKWEQKLKEAKTTQFFNASSKQQLRWLFFERLYALSTPQMKKNWKGDIITKFNTTTKKEWVIWESTIMDGDKELLTIEGKAYHGEEPTFSMDKEVLGKLGNAGGLLSKYNALIKERGYIEAMLASLDDDNKHAVSLRVHGTVTGRCSGGGYSGHTVNIQQIPKTPGYLENLKARPGHKLVQFDFSALEPVVLTELSQDKAMWQVYGSGIVNDIYLAVGSRLGPLKEGLTKYGYDPESPTPEAIKETKKNAKNLRGVAKVIHLAASYGAGAAKIWKTLVNMGYDTKLSEAKQMLKDYWNLFSGVKDYEARLKAEWNAQRGWFLNGRDCPMSVPTKFEKDLLNRCIQSTGHTHLLTFLVHLDKIRTERQLNFKFIVCDFHDETVTECPKDEVEQTVQAVMDALTRTNNELGGSIALSGEPEVCDCFAEFKVEAYTG